MNQKTNIAFSIVLMVLLNAGLVFTMSRFQSRKPDFAGLYQAGRALIHQRFRNEINRFPFLNGSEYQAMVSADPYPADTMHPPFEMIIFASLALLKYRVAYLVWYGCNLIMLFSVPILLWNYAPRLHHLYLYLVILIATFFPALLAAVQGQDSILLLLLLVVSLKALKEEKDFLAGFALSMGMFKFVLVLPIALFMVIERRWRTLAGFATGCATLLFVSLALVGKAGILAYSMVLIGYGKAAPEQAGTESVMPNLRGFVHVLGTGIVPEKWLMAATLIVSLALLIFIDARSKHRGDLSLRFSTQVILATLVSYHLYPHDATILILPLIILLNQFALSGMRSRRGKVVAIAALTMYLSPFIAPLQVSMPLVFCASVALLSCLQLELRAPLQHSTAFAP